MVTTVPFLRYRPGQAQARENYASLLHFFLFSLFACFPVFLQMKTPDGTSDKQCCLYAASVVLSKYVRTYSPAKRSIGQSFSALGASSLQDVSAVSGFLSLSAAVLHFSLTFLRLISSQHLGDTSLIIRYGSVCAFQQTVTLFTHDI